MVERLNTELITNPFNVPLSGTTRVSRYQKGKTNLGHMQVCTSLQADNHASTSLLSFYRPDALPAAQPTVLKHWRQNGYNVNNLVWAHTPVSLYLCIGWSWWNYSFVVWYVCWQQTGLLRTLIHQRDLLSTCAGIFLVSMLMSGAHHRQPSVLSVSISLPLQFLILKKWQDILESTQRQTHMIVELVFALHFCYSVNIELAFLCHI